MVRRRYFFPGDIFPREEFLDGFMIFLDGSVGVRNQALVIMFMEIAKNIYDHAGGNGVATFLLSDHAIHFFIRDYGIETFNLDSIRKSGSSLAGNGVNYGVGIAGGAIESIARGLKIGLRINTSRGFAFRGRYQKLVG